MIHIDQLFEHFGWDVPPLWRYGLFMSVVFSPLWIVAFLICISYIDEQTYEDVELAKKAKRKEERRRRREMIKAKAD